MATPKLVSAQCPTCGASLPVPPGVPQVVCRYCNNVIHVEHRKPPPEVRPFGTPGAMPSTTLYVDPDAAAKASKGVGCMVGGIILVTTIIPLAIGIGPLAARGCKGKLKPFPIDCSVNSEIEVSGNFESAGPIVTNAGHNCKIHIKDSKLKGSTLVKTSAFNLELTLENVTIETTDVMVKAGSNVKARIKNSTLVSAASVFESDSNLEILELEGSTLESKGTQAIKCQHNLKVHGNKAKIRGKKAAITSEANLEIELEGASEVTASEGPALKTSSGLKLTMSGGKIEGAEGAIVTSSGPHIEGKGITITSAKDNAIKTTSGMKLDLTDSTVATAGTDPAIECDGGELVFANTKVTGGEAAIEGKNGLHLKLTKKSRLVGSTGYGVLATSNAEIVVNDATIEGALKGFKGSVNTKMKLQQGARIAGKKGGVDSEGNFEIEGNGAAIDGGTGPGIVTGYNSRVVFKAGALKGIPAIQCSRNVYAYDVEGTKVEGEQKCSK